MSDIILESDVVINNIPVTREFIVKNLTFLNLTANSSSQLLSNIVHGLNMILGHSVPSLTPSQQVVQKIIIGRYSAQP